MGIVIAGTNCRHYFIHMNIQHHNIIFSPGNRVIFPGSQLQEIFEHCRRKLACSYVSGESHEQKAFGLVAGRQNDLDLRVEKCLPFMKNARQTEPYKKFMDQVMDRHAIPSETPLAKRGWIADPGELLAKIKQLQKEGLLLIGAYHMHRVAWPGDPIRDTPTTLDTILAADSSMLMFIISMVNKDRPVMRAFYEGKPDMEVPIIVKDNA